MTALGRLWPPAWIRLHFPVMVQSGRSQISTILIISWSSPMSEHSRNSLRNIVELISAGAILVGLIFVGLELKQNTVAAEADTMQGLLELSNQGLYEIATNPELADLVV